MTIRKVPKGMSITVRYKSLCGEDAKELFHLHCDSSQVEFEIAESPQFQHISPGSYFTRGRGRHVYLKLSCTHLQFPVDGRGTNVKGKVSTFKDSDRVSFQSIEDWDRQVEQFAAGDELE